MCYRILSIIVLLVASSSAQGVTVAEFIAQQDAPIASAAHACAVFPSSVEGINEHVDLAQRAARLLLDQIIAVPALSRTFDNTCRSIDHAQGLYTQATRIMKAINLVTPHQEVKAAARSGAVSLTAAFTDLFFDQRLFRALQEYKQYGYEHENLSDERRYFFEKLMNFFKRNGLHLPAEQQAKIRDVQKQFDEACIEFESNIIKDATTITVFRNELAGLNEDFIHQLARDGDRYVLRCDTPTRNEVLLNCSVESTRRDWQYAYHNRAYPVNEPLIRKITGLRNELAQLLGFEDFAAWSIDGLMVGTPQRAHVFMDELVEEVQQKFEDGCRELVQDLPDGVILDERGCIKRWDYLYALTYYKKKYLDVDEREIARYFPLDGVLRKILNVYEELLGLVLTEVQPTKVWHDDVRVLEVCRQGSDTVLGYIFLDFFPRANKFSNNIRCCNIVRAQRGVNGQPDRPAVALVITNFPRASDGQPALLRHRNVECFFESFGQALQQCLLQMELMTQSDMQKRDFSSLSSAIFASLVFDKDVLKKISSNYQTGQPLSDDLIEKKIKLRQFDHVYIALIESMRSLISLEASRADFDGDAAKLYKAVWNKYAPRLNTDLLQNYCCSFSNFSNGCDQYFGYLWSKVLAPDCLAAIKKDDVLSVENGKRFADTILSKGGSKELNELLIEFLGRAPSKRAFLDGLGIE